MTPNMTRYFSGPLLVTLIGIMLAFWWGGLVAVFLVLLLGILEISISFDNAIINSNELHKMSPIWQKRFLIWGILFAVFAIRFLLPVMIVSLLAQLNIIDVFKLAFQAPHEYAKHLDHAQAPISAFGGMFLLLVFMSFLFDQSRSNYWLKQIEKKLNQWARLFPIKTVITLFSLLYIQQMAPNNQQLTTLSSGILGVVCFLALKALTHFLNRKYANHRAKGFLQLLYLEALDASFSLDGVITAFAITKDIVIILIGLTIGAIFVRALTLFLVHQKTLKKFIYLEHGAFYAIGVLALIMLITIRFHVPEIITGIITVFIIFLGLLSSILYNRGKMQ